MRVERSRARRRSQPAQNWGKIVVQLGLNLGHTILAATNVQGRMNGYTSRRRIRLRWAAGLLASIAVFNSVAAAEEAPAGAPANSELVTLRPQLEEPAISNEQLQRWIQELDDDRYAVREAAQKQLSAAGAAALEAVAEVASSGSLESATRAVSVLVDWSDAKDRELSHAALEHLARLTNRPTEAHMASERLAIVREAAAIEAIKKLGGRFDFDRALGMGVGPQAPLQVIIGPQWKGGVDGLKHLQHVRSARTLSLHAAPLDDTAIEHLAKCKHVLRIEMYGAGISAEAIDKLKPQLANVMIDVRSGARLGIRGLIIEQIVDDSPAEKAGLERNDRITEFAGKPIETFEQLTQEIARCQPGDTVAVKVLRGAETLEKKITFDRWGDDVRTSLDSPELQQGFVPQMQIQGNGRIIIQPQGRNIRIQPAQPLPQQRR
jgi:hypothetical protein